MKKISLVMALLFFILFPNSLVMGEQAGNLSSMHPDRGSSHPAEGGAPEYIDDVNWLRKAAEQGNAKAQNHLGVMYLQGRGVGKDDKRAFVWYRKSAEQGNAEAKLALARILPPKSGK